MLEVILLIAAVVVGIALVMRMDSTPRAPRVASSAPVAELAAAPPGPVETHSTIDNSAGSGPSSGSVAA